jgi:hypothetical protein
MRLPDNLQLKKVQSYDSTQNRPGRKITRIYNHKGTNLQPAFIGNLGIDCGISISSSLTAYERYQHGNLLPVAAIALAEGMH